MNAVQYNIVCIFHSVPLPERDNQPTPFPGSLSRSGVLRAEIGRWRLCRCSRTLSTGSLYRAAVTSTATTPPRERCTCTCRTAGKKKCRQPWTLRRGPSKSEESRGFIQARNITPDGHLNIVRTANEYSGYTCRCGMGAAYRISPYTTKSWWIFIFATPLPLHNFHPHIVHHNPLCVIFL